MSRRLLILAEGKSADPHFGKTARGVLRYRPEDVVRLKALEKENARLKRIVGEQALDIDMLREVARGNF